MPKSTIVIIIAGVIIALIIGLVFFYTPIAQNYLVYKPKIPQPKKIINEPMAAAPFPSVTPATPEAIATVEAVPKYAVLRDPFTVDFAYIKVEKPQTGQPAAPVVKPKVLTLQGIFMSNETKTAIIDDNVVSAGSIVAQGYTVDEIRSDAVVLSKKGKIKILRLK